MSGEHWPIVTGSRNTSGCSEVAHWRLGLLEESRSRFKEIQFQTLGKFGCRHGGGGGARGREGDRRSGGALTTRL
jgi:hypothetical protein